MHYVILVLERGRSDVRGGFFGFLAAATFPGLDRHRGFGVMMSFGFGATAVSHLGAAMSTSFAIASASLGTIARATILGAITASTVGASASTSLGALAGATILGTFTVSAICAIAAASLRAIAGAAVLGTFTVSAVCAIAAASLPAITGAAGATTFSRGCLIASSIAIIVHESGALFVFYLRRNGSNCFTCGWGFVFRAADDKRRERRQQRNDNGVIHLVIHQGVSLCVDWMTSRMPDSCQARIWGRSEDCARG
jgi:hypothetical protein